MNKQPREALVALDEVQRDVVHVMEEIVRVDLMLLDEPGKRRAVGMEVVLLHPPRLFRADVEQALDIGGHALVD